MQVSKALPLKALQVRFRTAVVRGDRSPRGLVPVLEHPDRFEVYVEGYPARVMEVLEDTFPMTSQVIGHSALHELVDGYVGMFPSRSYNINDVGERFPEFLKKVLRGKRVQSLVDLARFEWTIDRSFHSGRGEGSTSKRRVNFRPHVRFFMSDSPTYRRWLSLKRKKPFRQNRAKKPSYVLVYRGAQEVMTMEISREEYEVGSYLRMGRTLGQIFKRLGLKIKPESVFEIFSKWSVLGLFEKTAIAPP